MRKVSLDTHRIPMPELYKEECMNNDRRRIRDVFSRIDDRKDTKNIHLKDYLIAICPQITEIKFDDENILKRRYSRLNSIIKRRFLKRHYNKRDDRIVFYNFIENLIRRYVERRV